MATAFSSVPTGGKSVAFSDRWFERGVPARVAGFMTPLFAILVQAVQQLDRLIIMCDLIESTKLKYLGLSTIKNWWSLKRILFKNPPNPPKHSDGGERKIHIHQRQTLRREEMEGALRLRMKQTERDKRKWRHGLTETWKERGECLNVSVLDDSTPNPNPPKSALSFLTQKPLQRRVVKHSSSNTQKEYVRASLGVLVMINGWYSVI